MRPEAELPRSLTTFDATLINVGTMLASGIFITPAAIARGLDASVLHVLVWLGGGLFCILGALSIAELGAMMPRTGGLFVYLERAYGPLCAFLYGWALFVAIQCGAIAAVAVATGTYLGYFIPLGEWGIKGVAVAGILALTWVNCRGVTEGAFVQNTFTLIKIAAVVVLVALSLRAGSVSNLAPLMPQDPGVALLAPFGLAMVAALWCYDGWIHVSYIAGEVVSPERAVPRAAMLSTFLVLGIYLALNLSYLMVLGVPGMAASDLVASEMALAAVGAAGGAFVAGLVTVSTLGANNGFILAGARVYYAMARRGLFFRWAGRTHPVTRVPAAALVLQGIWSSLLVFTGRYDQIFTYVIFVEFTFFALAAGAVILLRRREPQAHRPYRVPLYPWVPAAFILFAASLVASTVMSSPREAAIGTAVMASGLPAYAWWRRRAAVSREDA